MDSQFKSYGIFKISAKIWACNQPLPIQQKLPKTVQKQLIQETLKFHQNLRFWFFYILKQLPCVEGAPKHVHSNKIFNTRIFYMPFSMSKNGLCMWISAYCVVQNDVFLKVPYVLWIWDFVDTYLTYLGTRIWSPLIHTYSKKWFFWPPKLWCTPWAQGKKLFLSNLKFYDLANGMNECLRFGGRVNIQVSYKILWLEVPKKTLILYNPICFQEGLFWGNFEFNATSSD